MINIKFHRFFIKFKYKKSIFFVFLLLFFTNSIKAQNKIDSLKNIYNSTDVDSTKFDIDLLIANEYFFLNIDSSIYYANNALKFAEKLGNNNLIAIAQGNLAQIFTNKKDYINAIKYSNLCKNYFKSINSYKEIQIELNLFAIATENGDTNYILKNFDKLVSQSIMFKDTFTLYSAYYYYAKMQPLNTKAQQDTVENYMQLALNLAKLSNNIEGENQILSDLVDFCYKYKQFNNLATLIKNIDQTIEYFKKTENNWNLRYSLHIKGLITIGSGLNNSAIPSMLQTIENCNIGLNDNDGKIVYWELKYKYDSTIGNVADAFKSFQQFHKYDKIFAAESGSAAIRNLTNSHQLKTAEKEKADLEKNLATQQSKLLYQRSAFIISILALLSLFAFYYFWRKNKIIKNDLALQKHLTENELKTLRTQLNPHFIQNTFDFIGNGLRKNDTETNVKNIKYLSHYFRNVLNATDKTVHSLEGEIAFMEEYIKMQLMLSPNLFNYSIKLDDNVDTIGIMLPTLLLQPIVENSIKHGFSLWNNKGVLIINITQQQDFLKIVIGNNYKKSDSITKNSIEGNGLDITRKKLAIFYNKAAKKPSLEYGYNLLGYNYATIITIYL